MPAEMIPCPHCGTHNSAKKHVCFHCQREMQIAPDTGVKKRRLRPTSTPRPQVQQRALATGTTLTPPAAPKAEAPRRRKPASIFLGATIFQRVQVYRQLQSLLQSGIPLGLGLNYLSENIAIHLRPMARDLANHVQSGGLLSDAMARYPSLFPEWEVSLMKAAETGGTLPQAMRDVGDSLEMEMELRSRVSVSTFHLKATFVVMILVLFVVAAARSVSGDVNLLFQRLTQAFGQFLLVIAGMFAVWQGWRMVTRTRKGSRLAYTLAGRMPFVGPIMRNMVRMRFATVLAALWNAGVAPIEAVETAARTTGSAHIVHRAREQLSRLGQGATLTDVLGAMGIFQQEAMYLIQSGEMSGSVVEALHKVAEYVRMELEAQVKTLPAKLQLVGYAILVPIVLYILISFYTGYFRSLGLF